MVARAEDSGTAVNKGFKPAGGVDNLVAGKIQQTEGRQRVEEWVEQTRSEIKCGLEKFSVVGSWYEQVPQVQDGL